MRKRFQVVKQSLAMVGLVVSAGSTVRAADGTWTGSQDAVWTNAANWSSITYPGHAMGETATFTEAGAVIDLDGLASIGGVRSSGAAAFTLGIGGANAQMLALEDSGVLRLAENATSGLQVNAAVRLGTDRARAEYGIYNDSPSQTLTFAGAVVGAPSGGTADVKYLTVGGVGPVLFGGGLGRGGSSGLVLTNASLGTVTFAGDNMLKALVMTGPDGGAVDIGSGELYLSNAGTLVVNAERDAVIGGTGTLRLSTNNDLASGGFDYSNFIVAEGKTLVIDTPITGPGGVEFNSGTGTLVLNGLNTFDAHISFTGSGTISAAKIGKAGSTDSNFGRGSILRVYGSGARLLYTGQGETTDRVIRLERSFTLEHGGAGMLIFSSDFDVLGNVKTLTLQGDTDGVGVLAGAVAAGSGTTSLAKRGSGTWVLGGANSFSGETTIYGGGPLILAHPAALAGTSQLRFYSVDEQPGVLELAHDGAGEVPFNVIIGVGNSGTILSGNATDHTAGVNHILGDLNLSMVTLTVARASSILTGSPAVTFGDVNLSAGGAGTTTMNPTTADMILGGAAILANNAAKTLRLAGLSTGSRVDGVISNGINELSVAKAGAGVWALTGANTYTGPTTITGGTLALAGPDGAILGSTGLTLAGGTLVLDNTVDVNADRIDDAVPITLAGGALVFAHASGAADVAETCGALVVACGTNTVSARRAADGQMSTLTFASLGYTGGTVNFEGEGLGEDGRNRILFVTPPTLHGGVIGPWVTVNGVLAAYDAVNGLTAYTPAPDSDTEIDARGPVSVIPDDAEQHVRITGDGEDGAVALAVDETEVATLTQEHPSIAATVGMADKMLRAATVSIAPGAASLKLGAVPGEGVLAAPTSGGVLSLLNASDSMLTVNATLADNGPDTALGTFGTGAVTLNGPILHTGPIAANAGVLTFGGHDVSQAVTGAITGAGGLVKTGTNVLHLFGANTYTGAFAVDQGILRVEQSTALGTPAGGTVIASGATLDLGVTTRGKETLNLQAEPVTVGGSGAEGAGGAIINSSSNSQYFALGNVALSGDTVFGGNARWDIRDGTLAMNGHSITKIGQDVFSISGTEVTSDGDGAVLDVVEGTLRFQTTTRLNGGAANTVTVRSGARLELYQMAEPQMWTLALDDGASILPVGGVFENLHNRWGGPVVLNGAATLDYSSGPLDIQGPISGIGALAKDGSGQIVISGTDNTYTGTTSVLRGRLQVASIRNVGEPSSIGQPATPEAGVIRMGYTNLATAIEYLGAGDTTDRVIDMAGTAGGDVNLYQNGSGSLRYLADLSVSRPGDKKLSLYGTSSAVAEFAGAVIDADDRKVSLEKRDAGTWEFSGGIALRGYVNCYGGMLAFTGTNACSGSLNVLGGRMCLAGEGGFTGGQYISGGEMVFSGRNDQGSGIVRIGNLASTSGVMRVLSGANVIGAGTEFAIGYGTGSAGALYVEGGTLARTSTSGDKQITVAYGQDSYGYLCINDGTVRSGARLTVGGYANSLSNAIGIVRMNGGTLIAPNYVLLGRNNCSAGILTVQGSAVFDHANGTANFILGQNGGRADLNLLGGTVDSAGRNVGAREGSSGIVTGSVNLCAGVLVATKITVSHADSFMRVNFRGGTFKPSAAGAPLDASLTAVTLFGASGGFAGGAVIDTDGKAVTVAVPMLSPIGNGVTGVALADGGSGYIGEPLVTLDPPPADGIPATAIADMVPDGNGTYRVAGVTVTCPGSGYTTPPAVTFSGGGTLAVPAVAGTVMLTPDAGGGLTKTGAGTLTLSAVNTYAGPTVIADGTLRLGNAKALPTGTAVSLAGGTLDLNGYTVTNGVGGAGTLANGAVVTTLSPAGAGSLGTDTLTLSGATLKGTYWADVTDAGESDRVTVHGDLDLSGWTVTLVDPVRLNRRMTYTLLTCDGALSGVPTLTPLPDTRWHLAAREGAVRLIFTDGTLMLMK